MAKKRGRPPSTIPPAQYVKSVHVKLTQEAYDAVVAEAEADGRTVVQVVRLALKQYLETRKGKG
jgi:hypothetical protein